MVGTIPTMTTGGGRLAQSGRSAFYCEAVSGSSSPACETVHRPESSIGYPIAFPR